MKKIVSMFLVLVNVVLLNGFLYSREKLVQVAIEMAEVNNNMAKEAGITWLDSLNLQDTGASGRTLKVFDIGSVTRGQYTADVKLLLDKGAAELLANPKLLVKNGASANFKAGGEIPYIVADGQGGVSVEFKEYGVTLDIKPVVQAEDIDLVLKASVSSLDYSVSVSLSGNSVPGLLNREVTTNISVKSGTTITIAGLVQTKKEKVITGVPLLAEIPVVGLLFSHQKWINNKTTVVIFLTPSIYEE